MPGPGYRVPVDAEERLLAALAKAAHERLYEQGDVNLMLGEIEQIATEQGASDSIARHVLRQLAHQGLLTTDDGHFFQGDAGLAILYEDRVDRSELWRRNAFRRELLCLAVAVYESDDGELAYAEDGERFTERPYAEAVAAARVLEYWGLAKVQLALGKNFWVSLTPAGYDLARDEEALRRDLPTTAADDEEAHAAVARDALAALIASVDQLLEQRGWEGARRELARGDRQYDEGHWVDAVGEYYSALESGLKHRLDEAGATYGDKAALRDLSRTAVQANLLPPNYQQLFGFADSIRSPRRHGAGGQVEEVEVGPAEALLMGNHVRALLLYLGQRP